MPEPTLPGFAYDLARARFIAEGVRPTLQLAKDGGASVPDQLAGLALAIGAVVSGSRLRDRPAAVAEAVASFLKELLGPGS